MGTTGGGVNYPFGGIGGAGGAGGPSPNTILWSTVFAAYAADDITLLIPRIVADSATFGWKVPEVTDQVTVGSASAVITHVQQIAGSIYTALTLAEPLGTDIDAGATVRVDRLIYREIEQDSTNAAISTHGNAVQARASILGPGASMLVTMVARNGQFVGNAGNGVRITLRFGHGSSGFSYSPSSRVFTAAYASAKPTMTQLRNDIIQHWSQYFSVGAIAGNGNAQPTGADFQTWTMANGAAATPGATSLTLRNNLPIIEVGDTIVFIATADNRERVITGVNHSGARSVLTWDDQLDFNYANGSAILIVRAVGYFLATAQGPKGATGRFSDELLGRTNIGSFDGTITVNGSTMIPVAINLTEEIMEGNDYQVEITDDSGFGALSPMFSGEHFRAKVVFNDNPANHRQTITTWLALRFNNLDFNQNAVERWAVVKGAANNRSVFVGGTSANQGSDLVATVWKYPRRGSSGQAFPVYIWRAKGATERYGDEFPNGIAPVSNRARLEFRSDNPEEKFHTEDNPASWWVAAPANLDATGAPGVNTPRVVFKPPAGTWKFQLPFKVDGAETGAGIGMFESVSGTDDEIRVEGPGTVLVSGFGATSQVVGRVESDEIITTGTREFYFMGNWDGDVNYYLRAEKVA